MLKNNPVVKKLMETGEERMGKIAQQLLSNEKLVGAVQTIVTRSMAAKGSLDKSLRSALSAMSLPSTQDVESLRGKVEDMEKVLSTIETKVEALSAQK